MLFENKKKETPQKKKKIRKPVNQFSSLIQLIFLDRCYVRFRENFLIKKISETFIRETSRNYTNNI